jgi:cell wall-associated NlpC family hydrolase
MKQRKLLSYPFGSAFLLVAMLTITLILPSATLPPLSAQVEPTSVLPTPPALADYRAQQTPTRVDAVERNALVNPQRLSSRGGVLRANAEEVEADAMVVEARQEEAGGVAPSLADTSGAQLEVPAAEELVVQSSPTPSATSTPLPTPTATPKQDAASTADTGARIAALAAGYVGFPYRWAGHSPRTGFDCSGFSWYVYDQVEISVPNHDLKGQLNAGPRLTRSELQPGDLVFFQNTYKAGLSHSGVYIGDGAFVHAVDPSLGVRSSRIDDAYWAPRFLAGSRPR